MSIFANISVVRMEPGGESGLGDQAPPIAEELNAPITFESGATL